MFLTKVEKVFAQGGKGIRPKSKGFSP